MRRLQNVGIALLVLIIVALVAAVIWADRFRRSECEDRGGRVIHIQNSRDASWFCQE
jgi:hypothetical protein